MEEQKDLHRRILVNLGIALAGILLLVFVVPPLIRLLMPLIVAWIVAMIANPIIRFLEKRIKLMRKHGTAYWFLRRSVRHSMVWWCLWQASSAPG